MKSYKNNHEENENHERWLVSYADFITLLFAFFVVLYATSNSDLEKQKNFEKSIEKSLGTGDQKSRNNVIVGAHVNLQKENSGSIGMDLNSENKMIENEVEEFVERYLSKNKVKFESLKKQMKIEYDTEGLIIRLKKENLFEPGSEIIKNESKIVLEFLGGLIKGLDSKLILSSYAQISDEKKENFGQVTLKQFESLLEFFNKSSLISKELISFSFHNRNYHSVDSDLIHFIIKR